MDILPLRIAEKSTAPLAPAPAKGSLQFIEQVKTTNASQVHFLVSSYFNKYDAIELRFSVDTLGSGQSTYAVFGLNMLTAVNGSATSDWYTTNGNAQSSMGITANGLYQFVTGIIYLDRVTHWANGLPGLMVRASTATDGNSSTDRLTRQTAGSVKSIQVLSLYNGTYNFSATASVFGLVK